MKINIFTPLFFLYIFILVVLTIIFGFLFWNPNWIFSQLIIASLIVVFTLVILRHLKLTEREVARVLLSIKYQDFSGRIKMGKGRSFLYNELKEIRDFYEERENRVKTNNILFNEISENISSGLIVYSDNGQVIFQNESSRNLLGISELKEIYQLKRQIPKLYGQLLNVDYRDLLIHLQPKDYDYNFSSDLILQIQKRIIQQKIYTILKISLLDESDGPTNFEAWINFGKVISHEILNGMSPILSLSESINDSVEELNEDKKMHIQSACSIITERCNSLIYFTEKYKNLVKIPTPELERNNLLEIINETISDIGNMLDSISVKVDFEDNTNAMIMSDKGQLKQVFLNLFLNSIHAMKERDKKEISIKFNENKSNYLVLFHDNGSGISKELLSQIFVPYFSTKEDGSGIGLALCRQILWKHKASIHCENVEFGSCFSILFPKIGFS